ncbi:MAG: carbohydrate-binding family 9-like protein [Candidatus Latescibacteria bacterium]|jgi:hypothetical protein|nr:carbohydrate-binding family 9-like protein [Candidatus Latescibacterota bacterium]
MDYTIRSAQQPLGSPTSDWDNPLWDAADTLDINLYRWEDSGHHPHTQARVLYDDDFLAAIFRVEDRYVRAVSENFGDPVSQDSCVEFFLSPYSMEQTDAYFNFELSCGGTLLLRRCSSSAERGWGRTSPLLAESDASLIRVAHSLPSRVEPEITEPTSWTVEFHVPFELFGRYFVDLPRPTTGTEWKGNLYKCAGASSHPHWGTWAPIHLAKPSFHAPAFFQPLHFS